MTAQGQRSKKDHRRAATALQNGKVRSSVCNRKLLAAPAMCHPPRRTKNLDRRTREYQTPGEVEKLLQASSTVRRYGARDQTSFLPTGMGCGINELLQSSAIRLRSA
jgi:hypothetical protein